MPRARSVDRNDTSKVSHKSHGHSSHHHARPSRSPHEDNHQHRHKRRRTRSPAAKPVVLPYKAKQLSRRQFEEYKPLFQSYLDIQKHIQLDDLDEREVKGRWKSFTSRWNRGELARSWYDPSMLQTAQETVQSFRPPSPHAATKRASPKYEPQQDSHESSEDDDFGPAPPTDLARHAGHGPTIPRLDDLTYRNEMRKEDRSRDRAAHNDDLRHERKTERKAQKDRLEELAPRADPGSRERQLEKKRETTSTLQSFRDAKESGDVEVAESELMGDDDVRRLRGRGRRRGTRRLLRGGRRSTAKV
ncbi:hypothetical protein LEMA_P060850.1 [Plenodomus lingam JN3]|uniref:Uncharacterized protein n=1 Tax=Leptosphaeria maculans (strain JN3 / isolate v23.1.3 / race Av1-4-5-6-7-8) TaxID=985895 RepID=E4ZIN0_LEPMJ|nr:hypothetical protein LEMA_P060850.1 [Plenodomus lingam JN3]CBX91051.1 hypothetical protein LEMA_P060850.1 [Plenodomus lingam JN3]